MIGRVHMDYLEAGADVITTASYQASHEGMLRCGYGDKDADAIINLSVELAGYARGRGLHEDSVLPRMDEGEVYPRLAVAAGLKAQEQGVAGETKEATQLHTNATKLIRAAQEATTLLMNAGIIPGVPETP